MKNPLQFQAAKYKEKYNRLGFAFAPLVANSFGQLGSDLLRFLWLLANFAARNKTPVPLLDLPDTQTTHNEEGAQKSAFKKLRSKIFIEFKQKLQTEIYEGITERVFGRTYSLQANPQYRQFFAMHRSIWTPEYLATSQVSQTQDQSQLISRSPQLCALDGIVAESRTSTLDLGNFSPQSGPQMHEEVDEETDGTQRYAPSSHSAPSPPWIISGASRATSYARALDASGGGGV